MKKLREYSKKPCRFCYRISDNYIHLDDDDYHCSNPEVQIFEKDITKGSVVKTPEKYVRRVTKCIILNDNNGCKGHEQLEIKEVPVKFLGFVIGQETVSNKLIEDYEYRMH